MIFREAVVVKSMNMLSWMRKHTEAFCEVEEAICSEKTWMVVNKSVLVYVCVRRGNISL